MNDSPGIALIRAERERQLSEEGWTPEHDDKHKHAQLADAACCYAAHAKLQATEKTFPDAPLNLWPWDWKWWKPSADPIRNLVKAGALIAAEIDRLQRLQPKEPE